MPYTKTQYAVGISAGLIGSFLIYHQWQKYKVRKKLEEMARQAAAGEIPTKDFLSAVLASGQPIPGTGKVVKIGDQRLKCSDIFPESLNVFPFHVAAMEQLKRDGECL